MISALKTRLINKSKYLNQRDLEVLKKAIEFAESAHHGQKRVSGKPYVTHPFAVCEILLN